MCLDTIRKESKYDVSISLYKVFGVGRTRSGHLRLTAQCILEKPCFSKGWNKLPESERDKTIKSPEGEYPAGFHAYENETKSSIRGPGPIITIVPITSYVSKVLCEGTQRGRPVVVVSEFYIDPSDYDAAINRVKRNRIKRAKRFAKKSCNEKYSRAYINDDFLDDGTLKPSRRRKPAWR